VTFSEPLKNDGPPLYFTVSIKNMGHPIDSVLKLLREVEAFNELLRTVKKSIKVVKPDTAAGLETYFLEAGVIGARAWFLGDVDSIRQDSLGRTITRFTQNHDSTLNKEWKGKCGGWLKVEFHEFEILGYLKEIEPGKTRIALIAYVAPDIWIPRWLFLLTSKVVFPRLLRDMEKRLDERRLKGKNNVQGIERD